jgi:hypothetical protein
MSRSNSANRMTSQARQGLLKGRCPDLLKNKGEISINLYQWGLYPPAEDHDILT